MSRTLMVHRAGPGVTVQDGGRTGYLAFGLSRGGAADRRALAEGAVLLGQDARLAVLEMAGVGGVFEAGAEMRIALTGAPMRADIDGRTVIWNASHRLPRGGRLSVGAVEAGFYGYLHLGGGIDAPVRMGGRGAHLAAGIGAPVVPGDRLALGRDDGHETGLKFDPEERFDGGEVRLVPGSQTGFFSGAEIARFEAATFRRDARGNRMGVRLLYDGAGFDRPAGLTLLSEVVVPGDVQIAGDGAPFVLLGECQTTGGYPRIGSVLPADLPRVAQAPPGAALRFRFVTLEEAVLLERHARDRLGDLRARLTRQIRDPASIPDLLSYQLISGVTAGDDRNGREP